VGVGGYAWPVTDSSYGHIAAEGMLDLGRASHASSTKTLLSSREAAGIGGRRRPLGVDVLKLD
jgi:hypothetical protein